MPLPSQNQVQIGLNQAVFGPCVGMGADIEGGISEAHDKSACGTGCSLKLSYLQAQKGANKNAIWCLGTKSPNT